MVKMFDFKAKFALLCMAGLLIVIHWSQAADYDEEFDHDENVNDLGNTERSYDDLQNEEAHILQRGFDVNRKQPRRGQKFFRRRFPVGRRRIGTEKPRPV